jgi:hydrogenase nickel incorporation protein HypA/HybF
MHEMAITQSVVEAVCTQAAGRRVLAVNLEVGTLTAVIPDAMQFCFDLATEGTVAAGAQLNIDMPQGRAHCKACDQDFELPDPILLCTNCGSANVRVISGQQLKILSMEVK